jgi:serine phosphatase RsbU (regulator of sigma subunit)
MEINDLSQKKQTAKKLTGSLAIRVFLVSFVFLVIPLIFHSLFMYRQEYELKKNDVFSSLKILSKSRLLLFDDIIDDQRDLIKKIYKNTKDMPESKIDKYLIAKVIENPSVFASILEIENGSLICKYSSDKEVIGKKFSFLLPVVVKGDAFSIPANKAFPYYKDSMWVGKIINDQNKKPKYVIVSCLSFLYIFDQLKKYEEPNYKVDLYLVDNKGSIYFCSDPAMMDRELIVDNKDPDKLNEVYLTHWHSKKHIHHYTYKSMLDEGLAYKIPIADDLSLALLVSNKNIFTLHHKEYFIRMASFLSFVLIFGGGLCLVLIFRMAKPLKALCDVMQRVAEDDLKARYIKDKMGFEVNYLGSTFNDTIEALIEHQKEVNIHKLEKQKIEQELKIGHEIQKSMLPYHLPEFPGLDVSSGYLPARVVGGDFYDLFIRDPKNPKELLITIADTSDKGISACLYALNVRSILRSFATIESPLWEVAVKSNNLFCLDTQESGFFVTSWMASFDKDNKRLCYTSCGHYPALIRRANGEIVELNTSGIALGVETLKEVKTDYVTLEKGDYLFLYTDGILDATDIDKKVYGKNRLYDFMKNIKPESSSIIIKNLLDDIKSHTKGAEQSDDLTALLIKIDY